MIVRLALMAVIIALAVSPLRTIAQDNSVLTYHGDYRSGNFVVPSLSFENAGSLRLDHNFDARVAGHLYAQMLCWRPSDLSAGMLLVATEDSIVQAIDAKRAGSL